MPYCAVTSLGKVFYLETDAQISPNADIFHGNYVYIK